MDEALAGLRPEARRVSTNSHDRQARWSAEKEAILREHARLRSELIGRPGPDLPNLHLALERAVRLRQKIETIAARELRTRAPFESEIPLPTDGADARPVAAGRAAVSLPTGSAPGIRPGRVTHDPARGSAGENAESLAAKLTGAEPEAAVGLVLRARTFLDRLEGRDADSLRRLALADHPAAARARQLLARAAGMSKRLQGVREELASQPSLNVPDPGQELLRAALDDLLGEMRPLTAAARTFERWSETPGGSDPTSQKRTADRPELGSKPDSEPPFSDVCASATPIGNGIFAGDTSSATTDGDSSCGNSSSAPDVWYKYTAPATGDVLLSTVDSGYETTLSLHTACPGTPANELACGQSEGFPWPQPLLSRSVTAGETLWIRVAGVWGDAGPFSLSVGPASVVSGEVREEDSGNPFPEWGAEVSIYDSTGRWMPVGEWGYGYTYVDASGSYSFADLPGGSYREHTRNWEDYIDELYDDIPCPFGNCDVTLGTAIATPVGTPVGGIDFLLAPGGSIAGRVTDAASGDPVDDCRVEVTDASGNYLRSGWIRHNGYYEVGGLPTGSYRVFTDDHSGHFDEVYDDLACPASGCDPTTGTPVAVTAGVTTSGIDFALDGGGRIAGTLTDEVTGWPIPYGVDVDIYNASDQLVSWAWNADDDGNYITRKALPTGAYFARTSNWRSYNDELYDDIDCSAGCTPSAGTPIGVTGGEITGGVDFALSKSGGVIAGTITDAFTGEAAENHHNFWVDIYDGSGMAVSYAYPDAFGRFISDGPLAPGAYYAVAMHCCGSPEYLDELYSELPCDGCDPTTGTAIAVSSYTTGIDFTLERVGAIAGEVTDSGSGLPIENAYVAIWDSGGGWQDSGYTDADGRYITHGGLGAGTYYAIGLGAGHFAQLYDGLDCSSGCDPSTGTGIAVGTGTTIGVDFSLDRAGLISGAITDEETGAPLADVEVTIWNDSGWWMDSVYSDATGSYSSWQPLTTGTFYASTWNQDGYLDEAYDDVPCLGCYAPAVGTPIPVTTGLTTSGIDFALRRGGTISGQVSDRLTGAPIPWAGAVGIYDPSGNQVARPNLDGSGRYRTSRGLPAGNYFAVVFNWAGYINQAWEDIECPYCRPEFSTPIPVVEGRDTPDIDFPLDPGGRIAGDVTELGSGTPVNGIWIDFFTTPGCRWLTNAHVWNGDYVSGSGLPTGSYLAHTSNWLYADEIYDDRPGSWCDPEGSTPIAVTSPNTTTGIDFELDFAGFLEGHVRDQVTDNPLPGEMIDIFDSLGRSVGYTYSDGSGYYTPWKGLPGGSYYVLVAGRNGYTSELYGGTHCAGCDPTTGTAIPVTGGSTTSGIDVFLDRGGYVSGYVREAGTGHPIGSEVYIYNAAGKQVSTAGTDGSGYYTTEWGSGLPTGTYYAATRNWSGYLDEMFGGLPCLGETCDPTLGTPISVTSGAVTTNRDFTLARAGGFSGRIWNGVTGAPLRWPWTFAINVYDDSGNYIGEGTPDGNGDYGISSLPTGIYYAVADDGTAWHELYDDLPCPAGGCDPTTGTPISVTAGLNTPGIDFAHGELSCAYLPWSIDLSGGSVSGTAAYYACHQIYAGDFTIGPDGQVMFHAGDDISLGDGFEALPGSRFEARTGGMP